MGPVVVLHDPDVAEFAEKRTAPGDLEHGAVVPADRPLDHRPVQGARPVDGEPFRGADQVIQRASPVEPVQDLGYQVFAVADADMVVAVQLVERPRLVERPADGAADDAYGFGVALLQVGANSFEVGAVLVDAAEQEDVRLGNVRKPVEAVVVQHHLETPVVGDMGGQGIGPDGHELGAVILGFGVHRIGGVDEGATEDTPARAFFGRPLGKR